MRTVLALILGVALAVTADAASLAGSISGRAVNAAGGAVANQRVDLVRGGQVVSVATTSTQGTWSFGNVAPGEYVVRTSMNGKLAGVRVTVADGAAVAAPTIVVPTAAVAPQFGALGSLIGSTLAASASVTAAVATAGLQNTDLTNVSAEELVAIFNALPAADQKTFAQAVANSTQVSGAGSVFVPAASSSDTSRADNAKAGAVLNVLQTVAAAPTGNTSIVIGTPTVVGSTGSATNATVVVSNLPRVGGGTTNSTVGGISRTGS